MKKIASLTVIFACICSCITACGNNYLKKPETIKENNLINEYDLNGYTPLMAAVKMGDYELVKSLIEQGADVNKLSGEKSNMSFSIDNRPDTNSALLICVYECVLVSDFLESSRNIQKDCGTGTDCKSYNREIEQNSLQRNNYLKILDLLLKNGADTEIRNSGGYTALFYARDIEIIKRLLAAGANINAVDNEGQTALFYFHDYKIARFMIENGADYRIKDKSGKTVADYIENFYDDDYKNYIRSLK